MASYLQIENISKSYGPKVLFEKIGFNINEGDKIALIAPNGTGKTSLMRILAGKDKSDSGGRIMFLKDIIKDYTFDKFIASEPWQKAIKEAAMEYAENPVGWFALCGQSGAGKTHLCTAISRKFLLSGKRVIYMLWRDEIVKIKEAAKGSEDSDELRKLLDRYKTADVLYIDDLFKTGRAADNTLPKPTPADINYAFEIINYRYNNPSLLTIISIGSITGLIPLKM